MIWCTCAETHKERYLAKVEQWYKQVKTIFAHYNPDYYCFVDGNLMKEDVYRPCFIGLNFVILTPRLGRSTCVRFEGWRRSFKTALEVGRKYNHILHIENDVKILHTETIFNYVMKDGFYVGWCKSQGFVETALMILNDKELNEKLIEHYSNEVNIKYSDIIPERLVYDLSREQCHIVFETDRIEGISTRFNPNYDFICNP
jgi:hypothetical protein